MDELASISAIALAIVLATAAFAKLRRPDQTAGDFAMLGLPLPKLFSRLVPLAELAVSILLIAAPGWGGVAAFVLLAGFTALLVSLIRSGQQVACSCFGAVSDEPVSLVEVARNVVLLLMAAMAATTTTLVVPSFAAIVAFSAAGVISAVAIQLVAFRRDVGVIWSTQLAGEAPS